MVVTKIIATLPRVITSAGSKEPDVEGGDSDTVISDCGFTPKRSCAAVLHSPTFCIQLSAR